VLTTAGDSKLTLVRWQSVGRRTPVRLIGASEGDGPRRGPIVDLGSCVLSVSVLQACRGHVPGHPFLLTLRPGFLGPSITDCRRVSQRHRAPPDCTIACTGSGGAVANRGVNIRPLLISLRGPFAAYRAASRGQTSPARIADWRVCRPSLHVPDAWFAKWRCWCHTPDPVSAKASPPQRCECTWAAPELGRPDAPRFFTTYQYFVLKREPC